MRKLIFALLLVLATPAHGEPTPGDHIPAQFHGLRCGDPDQPDLPYTRAHGTECPARSGEAQLSITADTVESTETRCKVLMTAYDKRAKELRTTEFCWYTVNDSADTKNGSVMISRYSIRNGKLHVIDKADAQ